MLNQFDFQAIEEMDPSLGKFFMNHELTIIIADGHKLVYDREVPFELRIQDQEGGPQEVGTLEAVRVKVLVQVLLPRTNSIDCRRQLSAKHQD